MIETCDPAIYSNTFISAVQPERIDLTVSEWADQFRMLSSKASPIPGRWQTSRTPYLKEVMDALSPQSPCKKVVAMFASQTGKSESGFNWIGYNIAVAPGPMLMVQPTTEMVKKVVHQRLNPVISETPEIAEKVAENRTRDSANSMWTKDFDGGTLIMAGANAPASLASMPIRYLFMDEIDRYPGDVGDEGCPVALAEARTRNFQNKKIFYTSTPTVDGESRIQREFEESDQRFYFVPCPDCQHLQPLRFANLKWPAADAETGAPERPEEAEYQCEACGVLIPHYKKAWMLDPANGARWIATRPENSKNAWGFHLNALYSPFAYAWGDIAKEFIAAKKKVPLLKTFTNTVLAEVWIEKGDAPEWELIYRRKEPYKAGTVQRGVLILTAGVDVQRDRIEVEIVGWGKNFESWSVDYVVLYGDTSQPEVWRELWELKGRAWPHVDGFTMKIAMMCVDSGDQTQVVYNAIRQKADPQIRAVKGMADTYITMVGPPKEVDVNYAGKRIRRGISFWPVGGNVIKTELYSFLRQLAPLEPGDPVPDGLCHFPEAYEKEYFRQLTAETKQRRRVGGRTVVSWEKIYERNEAMDCRVYARAALNIYGFDRFTPEQLAILESTIAFQGEAGNNSGKKAQKPKRENPYT